MLSYIMDNTKVPTVLIYENTYDPPSLTAKRCYELGQAIRQAVESWKGNERVCVMSSGGLSHFVVLEEFEAHGWMLWPPVRYSYDTINRDYPGRMKPATDGKGTCLGYPAPPVWASNTELCEAPPEQMARYTAIGNWNWLGLDSHGKSWSYLVLGLEIEVPDNIGPQTTGPGLPASRRS